MNVRGFGISLRGGVDLDNNGYPDLAVGADNVAVVLRFVDIKIFAVLQGVHDVLILFPGLSQLSATRQASASMRPESMWHSPALHSMSMSGKSLEMSHCYDKP